MFEDLTVENYEVVYDPLSFDQIEMIVEKLAKYHALGWALLERGHEELKDFKMVFTEEMRQMFIPMMRIIDQVAQEIKTWPGYETSGSKIEKLLPALPDIMLETMKKEYPHDFTVLNHGDFHIRNLMFKKSKEGELSDVIFLDFQMPNYSMPVFDFCGLMTSMCTEEVRKREDEVLKMYQRLLVKNLKAYGFQGKTPTVVDIKISILRLSHYRLFYTFVLGPMFRLRGFELGAYFTQETNSEVVAALDAALKDPIYIEDIKLAVNQFESLGVLDG